MGKNGKSKKRKRNMEEEQKQKAAVADIEETDEGLAEEEIEITMATLNYLTANPEVFASKQCKDLRAALHPLVQMQLKK